MRKIIIVSLIITGIVSFYIVIDYGNCHIFYEQVGDKYELLDQKNLYGGILLYAHSFETYLKNQCSPQYLQEGHRLTQKLFEKELDAIDKKYVRTQLTFYTEIYKIHAPYQIEYCAVANTYDNKSYVFFANYTDKKISETKFVDENLRICS